jgi:hypothetical protein
MQGRSPAFPEPAPFARSLLEGSSGQLRCSVAGAVIASFPSSRSRGCTYGDAREELRATDGLENRLRTWLSCSPVEWLSETAKLAGMDGNRTHPGRLNSAPQTVLKTVVVTSASLQGRPPEMKSQQLRFADVR